jgi:hypothetical protein
VIGLMLYYAVYIHTCQCLGLINHVDQYLTTRKGMTEVVSIDHKRNHVVSEDELQLASNYSDSIISFLHDNRKYHSNNNHKSAIYDLDLPYGLIDLLIQNNFSVESLTNTNPSDLSCILAIDQEVATIVLNAANKKNHKHKKTHSSHRT